MYIRTLGPIKAANAAVVNRPNSRNCGDTKEDIVTKAARQTVFRYITSAASSGAAVLCASSDYEQLAGICTIVSELSSVPDLAQFLDDPRLPGGSCGGDARAPHSLDGQRL
jgi:hypothetical protein